MITLEKSVGDYNGKEQYKTKRALENAFDHIFCVHDKLGFYTITDTDTENIKMFPEHTDQRVLISYFCQMKKDLGKLEILFVKINLQQLPKICSLYT